MIPIKIAVVDDDQIYQFVINRTLTYIVGSSKALNFSNCADFFNFLKRNASSEDLIPDLVLLDLNTPFMNGWDFLTAYEALGPALAKRPVIYLISSSVDPNDYQKALNNDLLAGFFSKPLTPKQLAEITQLVGESKNEIQ